MKVVIITTRDLYHQYLCAEVAKSHHVAAVLQPRQKPLSRREGKDLRRKSIEKFGFLHHLLQRLGSNRFRSFGWNLREDVSRAQARFMPNAASDYQKHVAGVARDVDDVNSKETIELLKTIAPDAVICSGGPIYRKPLIESTKLMLNFHTGISPLYNGSYTIYWTYANRQPHVTGGTLMRMSPVIDGGDVLAHFLPDIEADDTPGIQFMKCIVGGTKLYVRFLNDLAEGRPFVSVPQGAPFLYYYRHDWTVFQLLALERHVKDRICEKHLRGEIVHEYWNLGDAKRARERVQATLLGLVQHA